MLRTRKDKYSHPPPLCSHFEFSLLVTFPKCGSYIQMMNFNT